MEACKDVEQRINILEEKDKYNDERFRAIERTARENKKDSDDTTKRLYNTLEEIKKGQHTQEMTNLKMDYTLDSINRERQLDKENKEQNKKEFRQLKWLIFGTVATLFSSLILAIIRSWLGI
ncbi:DUF2951 family protein [Staphylococcus shinii]|uniref:DUF2951 family protein n=1 Tax=Staphylococcus shinii TaxID=2912228 RepID=UPI00298F1466|nr:DUF2951 family protein [Staphylococcus shinii]MDW8564725.1 DUF2951 family protein [Staphylococcus shinii]